MLGGAPLTEQIRTTLSPDGVLLATIDMPDKKMNVFSVALMDALDALMDRVERDAQVRSVVLTSGKSTFLAGADLSMVRGFTETAKTATAAQLTELCGRLGRQFVRLEAQAKPWVAAVNGLALGGGLELALACRVRIVVDDPRTQIGVPEVRWGLLPGAGGTQRLPRLAPFDAAMDLLLTGRSISPSEAVKLGIFAKAVPAATLLDEARVTAVALHGHTYDPSAKYANLDQRDVSTADARTIAAEHGVSADDFAQYPAHRAIIESCKQGARLPLAEASAVEMGQFLKLMFDPTAGRMVRALYLERLRADRAVAVPRELQITSMVGGELDPLWRDALNKLPVATDASFAANTLELVDSSGGRHRFSVGTLSSPGSAQAVLSPAGPYGRVLEIVGASDPTAIALLASRIGALAWRTPGPTSVLARLHAQPLEAQAKLARAYLETPDAGDPAFLDVAACISGVSPAWSGGPLAWSA